MLANKQVAENFADGFMGHSRNMFIDKWQDSLIIYSYGYHFPIAIRTSDIFCFVNSDKYSNSTTRHQNLTIEALKDSGFELEFKTTGELQKIINNGGLL